MSAEELLRIIEVRYKFLLHRIMSVEGGVDESSPVNLTASGISKENCHIETYSRSLKKGTFIFGRYFKNVFKTFSDKRRVIYLSNVSKKQITKLCFGPGDRTLFTCKF